MIALTAPGGDYVFRSGPLGDVKIGSSLFYVGASNKTLYLYSSPYGPWRYPEALELTLFYPAQVYVSSTCGAVAPGYVGGSPGVYPIDLSIPPGFQGTCWVNFTYPSGLRDAVELKVKLIDWYPDAPERVAVKLNGSGWQFVQVDQDGQLYIWERPYLRLPMTGCVFVYNNSVLLIDKAYYTELEQGISPPVFAPAASGIERYGVFIYLNDTSTLYIYKAPCANLGGVSVQEPPPLRARIGVLVPGRGGPAFDAPTAANSTTFKTELRAINYTTAQAGLYKLYLYVYNTPVGMWGAVLHFDFSLSVLLTTEVSLFKPVDAAGPFKAGNYWIYKGNITYWVSGERPYYACNPPCGVPSGWISIYVVADPSGKWGGWPTVLSVTREALGKWGP